MNLLKDKILFALLYSLVISAEIFLQLNRYISLLLYFLVIFTVLFYVTLSNTDRKSITAVILLPVFRLVNVSMPVLFPYTLYWISLVYIPMLLSVYAVVRALNLKNEEIGLKMKKAYALIPIGVLIGLSISAIEIKVLSFLNLIPPSGISGIVTLLVVMFIFVALTEELIFRSVLQTSFEKDFGSVWGLLLASFIFAVMHLNYGIRSFIFSFFVGLLVGFAFQKTRSLPFVVTIRGVENFIVFGFLRYILPQAF